MKKGNFFRFVFFLCLASLSFVGLNACDDFYLADLKHFSLLKISKNLMKEKPVKDLYPLLKNTVSKALIDYDLYIKSGGVLEGELVKLEKEKRDLGRYFLLFSLKNWRLSFKKYIDKKSELMGMAPTDLFSFYQNITIDKENFYRSFIEDFLGNESDKYSLFVKQANEITAHPSSRIRGWDWSHYPDFFEKNLETYLTRQIVTDKESQGLNLDKITPFLDMLWVSFFNTSSQVHPLAFHINQEFYSLRSFQPTPKSLWSYLPVQVLGFMLAGFGAQSVLPLDFLPATVLGTLTGASLLTFFHIRKNLFPQKKKKAQLIYPINLN